jgi:hypothetical protein
VVDAEGVEEAGDALIWEAPEQGQEPGSVAVEPLGHVAGRDGVGEVAAAAAGEGELAAAAVGLLQYQSPDSNAAAGGSAGKTGCSAADHDQSGKVRHYA